MKSINDIQDFNTLFTENYANFLRFAYGYVRDQHIAEDFVSESFTTYWEKKEELDPQSNPKAYILTVLRNKCLNHLQQLKTKQHIKNKLTEHAEWRLTISINTLEACNPDFIFSEELKDMIDKSINSLPPKTKEIFLLSRNQYLTNKEISLKMKLTTKAVEYHITKALSQLRISLKDFLYLLPFLYLILEFNL